MSDGIGIAPLLAVGLASCGQPAAGGNGQAGGNGPAAADAPASNRVAASGKVEVALADVPAPVLAAARGARPGQRVEARFGEGLSLACTLVAAEPE